MKHLTRHLAVLVMLLALPQNIAAQVFGTDYLTIEQMIDDQKRIRSHVIARATIEQANEILHKESKKTTGEYRDVNAELDKYNRMFDIIDVIVESASVAFSAYNTYDEVKERVEGMKDLLDRYRKMIAEREYRIRTGISNISNPQEAWDWFNTVQLPIIPQDSIIFTVGEACINTVYEDAKRIVNSLYELALYTVPIAGAPPAACTTETILKILQSIDYNLADIRTTVTACYFTLWKYIHVRTGFWTQNLIPHKTIKEICNDAYGRWKAAQHGKK